MTIRVAHSPDSDDAFMFYALAEEGQDHITYVHELSDIESLNQRARHKELDVSAVSIHAYAYIADDYALLNSGSSMGDGYGPRLADAAPGDLVAPTPRSSAKPPRGKRIAVPGRRPPPTWRSSSGTSLRPGRDGLRRDRGRRPQG